MRPKQIFIEKFNPNHVCTRRTRSQGGSGSEKTTHAMGKKMVAKWLNNQPTVLQESIQVEKLLSNSLRRPDTQAMLTSGQAIALEIQTAHLSTEVWHSRHIETYGDLGVRDIWLWHPSSRPNGYDSGRLTDMLIFDPCQKAIGIPVVRRDALESHLVSGARLLRKRKYVHPRLVSRSLRHADVVYAPMNRWTIDAEGKMIPPKSIERMVDYGQAIPPIHNHPKHSHLLNSLWYSPTSTQGWNLLLAEASAKGVLSVTYGPTCARLSDNTLIIDRTRSFTQSEFLRDHVQFTERGEKLIWVVDASQPLDPAITTTNKGSFLHLLHPETSSVYALLNEDKYTLGAAVDYLIRGNLNGHEPLDLEEKDRFPAQNPYAVKSILIHKAARRMAI